MATEQEIKIAFEVCKLPLVDGAAQNLPILWGDLGAISREQLGDLIAARLATPAYGKFVATAPPSRAETPGSLEHAVEAFHAPRHGGYVGFSRPQAGASAGPVDMAGGMRSHVPPTHADLPGGFQAMIPSNSAANLAEVMANRLALQATPGLGLTGTRKPPRTK